MKTIQVRNVADHIHRTLRSRAAEAGLSLSDYILHELVRLARHPRVSEVLLRAQSRHGGAKTEDIVAAVRSGRDRG